MSEAVPNSPVLPEVPLNLHSVASPGVGTVVASRRCTASMKAAGIVRHVEIDISSTNLAARFRAGQSFGVIPPGVDDKGNTHKLRLYSIASPTVGEVASRPGAVIATTVKRLIDERYGEPDEHRLFLGVASNWLCDLRVGETVPVTGPSGKRFLLPLDTARHDYIFFATGTGIAPFRGMLRDLLSSAGGAASRVRLLMGVPYATDLLYDEEMRALEAAHSNFRYYPTLSREANGEAERMYVQDRLAKPGPMRDDLLEMLGSPRTLVYVCGIAGMELGIVQALASALPATRLHQFVVPHESVATDPTAWTRRMLHKQVVLTRRIFLEVY